MDRRGRDKQGRKKRTDGRGRRTLIHQRRRSTQQTPESSSSSRRRQSYLLEESKSLVLMAATSENVSQYAPKYIQSFYDISREA